MEFYYKTIHPSNTIFHNLSPRELHPCSSVEAAVSMKNSQLVNFQQIHCFPPRVSSNRQTDMRNACNCCSLCPQMSHTRLRQARRSVRWRRMSKPRACAWERFRRNHSPARETFGSRWKSTTLMLLSQSSLKLCFGPGQAAHSSGHACSQVSFQTNKIESVWKRRRRDVPRPCPRFLQWTPVQRNESWSRKNHLRQPSVCQCCASSAVVMAFWRANGRSQYNYAKVVRMPCYVAKASARLMRGNSANACRTSSPCTSHHLAYVVCSSPFF